MWAYTNYIDAFRNPELFIYNYAQVYTASAYVNVPDLHFDQRISFITHVNKNASK